MAPEYSVDDGESSADDVESDGQANVDPSPPVIDMAPEYVAEDPADAQEQVNEFAFAPPASDEIAFDPYATVSFSGPPTPEAEPASQEDYRFSAVTEDSIEVASEADACPFCGEPQQARAFDCSHCNAVLSFSDLEAVISNDEVDRDVVSRAVIRMAGEWNEREFSVDELINLSLGHLNLGSYDAGRRYLQEALSLDPNNVVLAGHLNSLAIRLDEIERQREIDDARPKGKTILVVDDSATVRKLISGKLEKSGHNVVTACDGVEALERISEQVPDLVLLDITMPRMDGYEVCKQIRSSEAASHVPVVMISGKDGFFDKVRGRMAGTTGYVTKPFGPETLMKALETYLLPDAAPVHEFAPEAELEAVV
jgi:twitching motility two-component system response regulator PilG